MACFRCPLLIINDGGPENQALTKELLERFNVQKVQVATYHSQLTRLVERGHQNIVDALAKLMAPSGKPGNWPVHLAAVSWADRITVRKSTGLTPYRVVFGQECLLPVSQICLAQPGYWDMSHVGWLRDGISAAKDFFCCLVIFSYGGCIAATQWLCLFPLFI